MAFRRERHPDMNINEIDFSITYQICQVFDVDRSWEQLAGVIGYSTSHIQIFELETRRHDGSPTKKLLWDWGTRGATIRDLYNKLNLINRTQMMRVLDPIMKMDERANKEVMNKENCSMMSKDDNWSVPANGSMPSSGCVALPIPKKHKKVCSQTSYSNVDVNLNTTDGKPAKPSEKDKQKLLGLDGVGTSPVMMLECRTDGPASGPGNYGAAASSARSFERVKSVVDEYDTTNTLLMSQLSSAEQEMAKALIAIPHYTYKELSQATEGFLSRYVIGEGKFGKVFRGRVKNTDYAIKKLFQNPKITQDNENLAAELRSLIRYRHENIVSLYAYALDGDEICLVYQYMHNGSLEDCLHKRGCKQVLTWEQRMVILKGAACGLQFLHSVDARPVIHGNIKSSNILLDRHLEAKIGDLAMAQQATKGDVTGVFTHITKKTTGRKDYVNMAYLAPEMIRGSGASLKGDSFSFGVVIFECLTGAEAFDSRREGSAEEQNLKVFVDNYLLDNPKCNKQKVFQDPSLEEGFPEPAFTALFDTAEMCTKDKKRDRPSMIEVYKTIETLEKSHTNADYFNFKGSKITSKTPKVQDLPLQKQASNDENTTEGLDNNPPLKMAKGTLSPLSPVQHWPPEKLSDPVKLQMKVDKITESDYVNVAQCIQDMFRSDPKKIAEIEKSDAGFIPGSMNNVGIDKEAQVKNPNEVRYEERDGNMNMKNKIRVPSEDHQPCQVKFGGNGGSTNNVGIPPQHHRQPYETELDEKNFRTGSQYEKNLGAGFKTTGDTPVAREMSATTYDRSGECHDYVNTVVEVVGKVDDTAVNVGPVTAAAHEMPFDFDTELEEIRGKAKKSNSTLMDIFSKYDFAKEEEDFGDEEFAAEYEEYTGCSYAEDSDSSTLKLDEHDSSRENSFHLSALQDEDLFRSGSNDNKNENQPNNAPRGLDESKDNISEVGNYDQSKDTAKNEKEKINQTGLGSGTKFVEMENTEQTVNKNKAFGVEKDLVEQTENRLNDIHLGGKRNAGENEEASSLDMDKGNNNQSGGDVGNNDQSDMGINMNLQKHRLKQAQYFDVLNDFEAKREGDMIVDNLIAKKGNSLVPKMQTSGDTSSEVKGPPVTYQGLKVSPVGHVTGARVPSESEYV